jgi:hypothetical protein
MIMRLVVSGFQSFMFPLPGMREGARGIAVNLRRPKQFFAK